MGVKTTAVFLYLCILNPPPPQMFAMNIRIEWQIVGCVHIPKSASHQPSFTLKPCKDNNCISVFWHTPPPNVWHEYQDGMKNAGLYTYHRNGFLTLPHSLLNQRQQLYFCICNATQYNAVQYNTTCVCDPVPAFLLYKNKQSFEICSLFRIRANIKFLSNFESNA